MKAKTTRRPVPDRVDSDFAEIRARAATLHDLHRQRVAVLTPIVQDLVRSQSRAAQEIEHTLDHLLDCACIPEGLALFKALCRHYYAINPISEGGAMLACTRRSTVFLTPQSGAHSSMVRAGDS